METLNTFEIFIPFLPPSFNNLYQRRRGAPDELSSTAVAWYHEAVPMLKTEAKRQGWPKARSKTIVQYWIQWPDTQKRDMDNYFKPIGDALKKADFVVDDNLILPQAMDYRIDQQNYGVFLKIFLKGAE